MILTPQGDNTPGHLGAVGLLRGGTGAPMGATRGQDGTRGHLAGWIRCAHIARGPTVAPGHHPLPAAGTPRRSRPRSTWPCRSPHAPPPRSAQLLRGWEGTPGVGVIFYLFIYLILKSALFFFFFF